MKTSFLKSLDAILSPAACFFASLLPKTAAPSGQMLILRPGGMGDLVCADIALQELSLDARDFTWLIESRSKPWAEFRGLPHFCYDVKPLETLRQLRNRFSLVINTEQLFGLTQAYGVLARSRGGRLVSFATNRRAKWSDATVSYDWKDAHETTEFARLLASALRRTLTASSRQPRPRLHQPSEPPLVVVAGLQSRSRHLDLAVWTAQISRWHEGRPFLIAASPEDAEFADQLVRNFGGLARRFEGTFPELCGQISRSAEIFTMDGGAVHIASFFGVPTLALFTSGRDHKWKPIGEGSRLLRRHDLPCQPCTKFGQVPPCPYQYACLKLDQAVLTKLG